MQSALRLWSRRMYSVKEIFYSIQGEGAQVGKPAVFCRFSGCNLWSGREIDRPGAICRFCDTDFVGADGTYGGKYERAEQLAEQIQAISPPRPGLLVVLTGGEPALQVDSALIEELHRCGFVVAIETNGTTRLPSGLDWICVSPKAGAPLQILQGNELKLVFPQPNLLPEQLPETRFDNYFIQPMDGPDRDANTRLAIEFCQSHPSWRLSVQTHKLIGVR